MKLDELKHEADKIGVEYDGKTTKGVLMRKIRDYHDTPSDTVMGIGRHKGNAFYQIPSSYGEWAMREEEANGDNMHPDLKRNVMWFKRQRDPARLPDTPKTVKMKEPEKYASIPPPPPESATGSSLRSWEEGREPETSEQLPIQPGQRGRKEATAASSKRRGDQAQGQTRMKVETDRALMEEIQNLEAKLAVLKDKADIPPTR